MTRAARNNRGGKRYGKPATAYENRTDLNQPIRTAPGQPYGMAQQQRQEQQAIPLPTQALPAGPASGRAASPGLPPSTGGAAPPTVAPGSLGPLNAPTNRPDEPITTGLSSGPGAGPEALQVPDPLVRAAAVLNQLGAKADPQTAALRARVNAMIANQGAA